MNQAFVYLSKTFLSKNELIYDIVEPPIMVNKRTRFKKVFKSINTIIIGSRFIAVIINDIGKFAIEILMEFFSV